MKVNFVIVAFKKVKEGDQFTEILHSVIYEEEPTENDFVSIIEELKTDPDFYMTDLECNVDYELYLFSENEGLNAIKKVLNLSDEINDNVHTNASNINLN